MAKVKPVGVTVPRWRENGHCGIKARDQELQDMPKKIVVVVGFETDGGNCGRNLGFGGEESGEDIHEGRANLRVP